jgi:hypothetical protein
MKASPVDKALVVRNRFVDIAHTLKRQLHESSSLRRCCDCRVRTGPRTAVGPGSFRGLEVGCWPTVGEHPTHTATLNIFALASSGTLLLVTKATEAQRCISEARAACSKAHEAHKPPSVISLEQV